ncbi:pyocin knob domain-containing protein [Paenibacillus sp. JJ-223]|uniref:pyocin knob domain-containing protein n=1 Tax=Paenibacillus sp. JJ-223 TaxID=2905647 RepID=UPI001F1C1573|nr:pyocin knob domain-containing protein [Paenibacillus sp. JJ-223]CAH1216157.1 hypothetical protein PAECIP111890_04365 [Paenibacillus sp. JJ-223]
MYNKQDWKDEIPDLTRPIMDPSTGKQKTDPQTGRPLFELVQEGTRITSSRLNTIEGGIEAAHTLVEQLAKEMGGNFVAVIDGMMGLTCSAEGLKATWTAGVAYVGGKRYEVSAGEMALNPTQGQYLYVDIGGVVKKTTSEATAKSGLLLFYVATDTSGVISTADQRVNISLEEILKKIENVEIPDASLMKKGIVQLSNKTDGTSETLAATEKAVRDAKIASVPRTGGVNMTGRLTMQQWGTFSASPNGMVLYGSNCYLDGSVFKFENTHADLGARGIYMRYTGGAGPEVYMFDTGPVATTAGAAFTPALHRIANTGDPWQKVAVTSDSGFALDISNANLNDPRKTGWYMGSQVVNAPSADWHYFEIIRHNDLWEVQNAYNFNRTTYQQRLKQNGVWTPWSPDLFTSVSNGKASIAAAITGKGVPTAADAPFATMAANINAIQVGPKYATGTVTSLSFSSNFILGDGSTLSMPFMAVSGLGFTPTRIVVEIVNPVSAATAVTTFPCSANTYNGYQIYAAANYTGASIRVDGTQSYVNHLGFRLAVRELNTQYRWHAYG